MDTLVYYVKVFGIIGLVFNVLRLYPTTVTSYFLVHPAKHKEVH